jgi:capsular polysaccharide transport system permease protein
MSARIFRNRLFILLVIVPTALAIVYFGFIASNVYLSESRFLLRSPQRPTQSGLFGQLLVGSGLSRSQDDTYSVHDYILSRDALRALDNKVALRAAFSGKSADFFSRFPEFGLNSSFEDLFRYYGKHVGVDYDPVSSISVLTVRAFTPEDAHNINDSLLEISENLVNTLNDRSREDLLRFAESEVKLASDRAKGASLALLNFRREQAVFEPDKQAALQLQGVAKIQDELISTEAELAQLKRLSPNNPQIPALVSRAQTLTNAIASEASKVTGMRGSLSSHASNFERLTLDLEFADKQLGIALAGLESARADAQQKQLYLERLVQPNLPDKAMEPKRVKSIFTVLIIGIMIWAVAELLIASIREHAD